jgi:hypothetical protein
VRKGEIFIRTNPNTFGLIGMEASRELDEVTGDSPPNDFGELEDEEAAEPTKHPIEW